MKVHSHALRMSLLSLASLVGAAALAAGCEGSADVHASRPGDPTAATSPAEPGSDGSAATPGSDRSTDGSSEPGAPATGPTEVKVGNITIMSTAYMVGTTPVEFASATGTFYRAPIVPGGGSSGSGCTTTTTGACTITACTFGGGASTSDAGSSVRYTDAGPVTVTGLLVNDGSMSLTPGGYGYAPVNGNAAFFDGGESVRIRAAGNPAGAPAFDVTLTAPSSMCVTSPVFDTQGRVGVAPGQDLAVAWRDAAPGTEVAVQISGGTQSASTTARCAFPAAAGQGRVPAAAIASVRAVGGQASVLVSSESRKVQAIDGWDITVSLQSWGIRPGDAGIASGLLQ